MTTPEEFNPLSASGSQTEHAHTELDRRVFHLKTLYDVSKEIFGAVEFETIITNFLLMTMGNFGVMEGFILTLDKPSTGVVHFVSIGIAEEDQPTLRDRARKLILKENAAGLDGGGPEPATVEAELLGAACVFPFAVESDYLGILGLGNKLSEEPFHEDDKELLSTLVNNLTVAMKNALSRVQLIEKERLEHELQLAADIQRSILPDELPEVDGFSFGACILPARHVGGDFYDVFRIDDDRMGLLIGDVADKGVPAALFMARAHALIMAEADKGMSSGEVIKAVNRHITRMHKLTQFVTVLYGILNLKTRELNYTRAGHEPPLVLTTDTRVERLPHSRGIPLGLMENIEIDQRSVVLSPGTTLLMYTDGMLDCRNGNGEPFGLERIKQTLSGLVDLNAQRVCDVLLETLKNYQDGAKQDDDVALVAVHVA